MTYVADRWLPRGTGHNDLDNNDPLELALAIPCGLLTGLLQATLDIETDVAEMCID